MLLWVESSPKRFASFIGHQERERRHHFNILEFATTFGLNEFTFLAESHLKSDELSDDERSLIQAFAAAVVAYTKERQAATG
jgi:hypothetical protein